MDGATPAGTREKNVLGRYELLDLIARGPRGDTYLGIDRGGRAESLSDGRVVMKIMHLGATPRAGWSTSASSPSSTTPPSSPSSKPATTKRAGPIW